MTTTHREHNTKGPQNRAHSDSLHTAQHPSTTSTTVYIPKQSYLQQGERQTDTAEGMANTSIEREEGYKEELRRSFALVKPRSLEAAAIFYPTLWEINPSTKVRKTNQNMTFLFVFFFVRGHAVLGLWVDPQCGIIALQLYSFTALQLARVVSWLIISRRSVTTSWLPGSRYFS